jgi:pimeloyl-ACP methyl ester carboxylesterase
MSENLIKNGFAEINGAKLYFEQAGAGRDLVLIHAAVCDSRMWDGVFEELAKNFRVLRYDMRGYGKSELVKGSFSYHGDVEGLCEYCEIDQTIVIGCSFGSRIALDFALQYPKRLSALVLCGPVVSGMDWSAEMDRFGAAEDAALESGDLDTAVALNVKTWVAGVGRTLDEVDSGIAEKVSVMQRNIFELQADVEGISLESLDPPAIGRLGEVTCPTLMIVGEHDLADFHSISETLVEEVSSAEKIVMGGCAHLPSMEKPKEFVSHILNFSKE